MSKENPGRDTLRFDRRRARRFVRLLVGAAVLGAGLLQSLNGLTTWLWAQRDPSPWLLLPGRLEQLNPIDPALRVEATVRLVIGLLLLLVGGGLLRRGVHS